MMTKNSNETARLIIGCGFLGERVAQRWLGSGSTVFATTRNQTKAKQFAKSNIRPIIGDVTASSGSPNWFQKLPEVDTVLWSVGFDRNAHANYYDVHVTGLLRVLDQLPNNPRVIFISSTGIWGTETGEEVDESTPACPTREAGRTLLTAETSLSRHPKGPGIVLRLAGLYGPDRLPRLQDVRENNPIPADPNSWLNLIHVDDAAAVICDIAEHSSPEELYAVSDMKPLQRYDWYSALAEFTNSPPPQWAAEATKGRGGNKRIDARRIWEDLCSQPHYPNAIEAMRLILQESA
jgi:nucleoside-diphosphate-sugar epimerase